MPYPTLTPNAFTKEKMVLSCFPCCPKGKSDDSLEKYFQMLKPGCVYCSNSKYKISIFKSKMCGKKIIVWGKSSSNIKPWSVSIITYDSNHFVHELYSTFFDEVGAEKYFTILSGEQWDKGDCLDDYCM